MDVRLIRANIALYAGDRLEVQRLLDEYEQNGGATNSLILWLRAQQQNDHELLIESLEQLLGKTAPHDRYHRLAREYLRQETQYEEQLQAAQRRSRAVPGINRRRIMLGFFLIVAIAALFILYLRDEPEVQPEIAAVPTQIPPSPEPTLLPDKSLRLNINDYTGRYDAGLIQIASVEDQSERVVDVISQEALSPVAGARFYALELYFECRLAICADPPEAEVTLVLDNELVVQPDDGVTVQDGSLMTSIALGRRTAGWTIFEVPIISEPVELVITPRDRRIRSFPVVIPLPILDSP